MSFSLNDKLNQATASLTGRTNGAPRKLTKWEFRAQPYYRILSKGLDLSTDPEAIKREKRERFKYTAKSNATIFASAAIAIIAGLVLGALLLLTRPAYIGIGIRGFINNLFPLAAPIVIYDQIINYQVFYRAGPLLLCALSVGFCYKCGLFNIGGSGQFTLGGMIALVFAIYFKTSWWWGLLLGIIFGMLIGVIPGLFKAFFNVNEVITSIMLNWISLFVCNILFYNVPGVINDTGEQSNSLVALNNPNTLAPSLDANRYLNITIVFGVVIAIILAIILYKTTFGYKLRAVGFNRDAAKYAGISDKKYIILSFLIGGALCGLAGAFFYLTGPDTYLPSTLEVASQGFDAIPIALLANNNPIGIIFTSIIISMIQIGGQGLQPNYNKEFIDVVVALILYASGFAALIQNFIMAPKKKKKKHGDNSSADSGSTSGDNKLLQTGKSPTETPINLLTDDLKGGNANV